MKTVLALTKENSISYCNSSIQNNTCNHILHQKENESKDDFMEKVTIFKNLSFYIEEILKEIEIENEELKININYIDEAIEQEWKESKDVIKIKELNWKSIRRRIYTKMIACFSINQNNQPTIIFIKNNLIQMVNYILYEDNINKEDKINLIKKYLKHIINHEYGHYLHWKNDPENFKVISKKDKELGKNKKNIKDFDGDIKKYYEWYFQFESEAIANKLGGVDEDFMKYMEAHL